jgi:hypothetical protein
MIASRPWLGITKPEWLINSDTPHPTKQSYPSSADAHASVSRQTPYWRKSHPERRAQTTLTGHTTPQPASLSAATAMLHCEVSIFKAVLTPGTAPD